MLGEIAKAGRYLGQSMRLMCGLPEYDTYVAHRESTHPGEPVMSYEEFFRERQEAGTPRFVVDDPGKRRSGEEHADAAQGEHYA